MGLGLCTCACICAHVCTCASGRRFSDAAKSERNAKPCANYARVRNERSFGQEAKKAFEEDEWLESTKDQRSMGWD